MNFYLFSYVFNQFFCLKDSTWAKTVFQRYSKKHVSAQSTTTLTPCQRSQCLRRHSVSIVNDYTEIMSAQSTTTRTSCQRSQRLRRHCVSLVNDYANIVAAKSTTMQTSCQHIQRLCGHCVSVVKDYADIVSAQSLTTLTYMKLLYFGKSKKLPTLCPRRS